MRDEQKSRLPASGDAGRQGRCTSPTDPTDDTGDSSSKLTEKLDIRCTLDEKNALREKAAAAGVSASELLREALGLTDAKRRKPLPALPPAVVRLVAQTTRDVQQLACMAREQSSSSISAQLDAANIVAGLLRLDRRLSELMVQFDGDRE